MYQYIEQVQQEERTDDAWQVGVQKSHTQEQINKTNKRTKRNPQ
jgi:hypothetical protein